MSNQKMFLKLGKGSKIGFGKNVYIFGDSSFDRLLLCKSIVDKMVLEHGYELLYGYSLETAVNAIMKARNRSKRVVVLDDLDSYVKNMGDVGFDVGDNYSFFILERYVNREIVKVVGDELVLKSSFGLLMGTTIDVSVLRSNEFIIVGRDDVLSF
jgi:hypothetical protein